MEDLTKHQLFLLLLLVSVVTGASSTVVTYTLLEQKPPLLTHTIQRVIERTTEAPKETLPPQDVVTLEKAAQARDLLIQDIARRMSPAVVSVIATRDVPVLEQVFSNPFPDDEFLREFFPEFQIPQLRQKGTQKQQVSAGTGFFVSSDGFLITNKHVVEDTTAEYSIIMNDGKKFPARVVARDSVYDMAVLKVEGKNFSFVNLGDSDDVQIGQTVVAIGNALGEFQNTVSVGVISGLRRRIIATGLQSGAEELNEVIQTDAAINPGNSGGPLLNLKGEAIALNTAVAQGAENIGFAIPMNQIKRSLESAQKTGKIIYPFIGVRHTLLNAELKERNNWPVDYGAIITKGPAGEPAVTPGSPAEKAGLLEGDIILELGGKKITTDSTLIDLIQQHQVGEKVTLKILRAGKEMNLEITLEERR